MTEETVQRPAQPALKTLLEDQKALLLAGRGSLDYGLRDGFEHRREVIEWYQAAVVRTCGHLAEWLPPEHLATDDALLAALISSEARRNWMAEPPPQSWAREQRRALEQQAFQPACKEAYEYMRKRAGEYLDDEEDIDPQDLEHPDEQANVAMRPGFQEKDREQRRALTELWDGFGSRDELTDWLHWLHVPTYGELDIETPRQCGLDDVAIAHLLGDGVPAIDARRYRERFAIGAEATDQQVGLLPAFVDGIQAMNAGELARRERNGVQTLRMGGSS